MSVFNKLASSQNRNDEIPNQELAAQIIQDNDTEAVKELVVNLANKDKAIQSDCMKVLYELGQQGKPELIVPYTDTFVDFLSSKNNRLVWGAMTALGTITPFATVEIWKRIDEVIRANNAGSVITQDWGVRVVATVSAKSQEYEEKLFPYLLTFLSTCISRDVPKHGESILVAVNKDNRDTYLAVLKSREKDLKPSQMTRIRKIYKTLENM